MNIEVSYNLIMIAFVRGEIAEKFLGSVVVDVAGVGYEIQVANLDYNAATLGAEIKFYTYHHVREQAEDLYGFSSLVAKRLFEMLITVQSVGPKAALAILSLGEAEIVRNAIASGDAAFVMKATGVGKKTAERVIVDLREKVGLPTAFSQSTNDAPVYSGNDEALDALMALGFALVDATEALQNVAKDLPTAQRVTLALRAK